MDKGTEYYYRFREKGDIDGLVEIVKEYKDGLILYINSIVNDIYSAEDLAEDTFFMLFTKRPPDKKLSSFKTWLYSIGRNIAIDYLRHQSKHKELSVDECYELQNDQEDIEFSYIRNESKTYVLQSLSKIKSEYRQVLWLTYFEELSNKETARIMKKSVHAVETLVYRARKALKEQLEADGLNNIEL